MICRVIGPNPCSNKKTKRAASSSEIHLQRECTRYHSIQKRKRQAITSTSPTRKINAGFVSDLNLTSNITTSSRTREVNFIYRKSTAATPYLIWSITISITAAVWRLVWGAALVIDPFLLLQDLVMVRISIKYIGLARAKLDSTSFCTAYRHRLVRI